MILKEKWQDCYLHYSAAGVKMTHCEHFMESLLLVSQYLCVHRDFYRLQRGRHVAF